MSVKSLGIFIVIFFLLLSCENKKVEKVNVPSTSTDVICMDVLPEVWTTKIDTYFQDKYDRNKFNGVVLFASCGKVFFKKAYGYANIKTKDSLSLYSNFQLASVSKPLTAIAVLQLYEKGLVDLDENIRKYIPELPYEDITVRMLLTHKSGLFNYMYFSDKFWDSWTTPMSNEESINLICEKKPDIWFYPGRRYNYSNTGFMLLASIVERVSGESFAYYMKDHVFKPAGMDSTFVYDACLTPEVREQNVIGYRPNGRIAENSYLNGVVGDKGVYSNVLDMFKLDQALYSNTVVKQETLEEAFTPQHTRLHIDDNYGLGWRLNFANPDAKIVYHAGWWKGFKTQFIRVLPNQATIVVLANKQRGPIPQRDLLELIGF